MKTNLKVRSMNESEVLEAIREGESAFSLLGAVGPAYELRFEKAVRDLARLLKDVQERFPDAQYCTASGGLNLLLGSPHSSLCVPQRELTALIGEGITIGDGDW